MENQEGKEKHLEMQEINDWKEWAKRNSCYLAIPGMEPETVRDELHKELQ